MIKLLAVSAAALVAAQASAATIIVPLGTIVVPPTQTFSPGVTFTKNGANSAEYEFDISQAMTLTASSFTNTAVGKTGVFNFSSIGLYSGLGVAGTKLETGTISPRAGGTTSASLEAFTLNTGFYTIAYSGNVSGRPASVGSSITFAAAGGVPEASVWMLMIAGFGLIGVASRRRSDAVAA